VNRPQEKELTPETATIRAAAVESGWRDVPGGVGCHENGKSLSFRTR
jgi:hypothetical protein